MEIHACMCPPLTPQLSTHPAIWDAHGWYSSFPSARIQTRAQNSDQTAFRQFRQFRQLHQSIQTMVWDTRLGPWACAVHMHIKSIVARLPSSEARLQWWRKRTAPAWVPDMQSTTIGRCTLLEKQQTLTGASPFRKNWAVSRNALFL